MKPLLNTFLVLTLLHHLLRHLLHHLLRHVDRAAVILLCCRADEHARLAAPLVLAGKGPTLRPGDSQTRVCVRTHTHAFAQGSAGTSVCVCVLRQC